MSQLTLSGSKKANSQNFAVFDIEAKDWIYFLGAGFYDGTVYTYCDSIKKLINAFSKSGKVIIYAHYGGKYDFRFLFSELRKRYDIKIKVINNGVGVIKCYRSGVKKFELRDSFLLLPTSLKSLTEDFNVKHKKIIFDVENLEVMTDEAKKYLYNDVMGLYELLLIYYSKFDNVKVTLPQQTLDEFKKTFDVSRILIDKKYDKRFHVGYYGGRCDVFKRYGNDLYCYDVNSMYPYVMKNNKYPIGAPYCVSNYEKNKLGIWRINWLCPLDLYIPILPYRQKNKKLIFGVGKGSGVYTNVEINEAAKNGYQIEVIKGWVWDHGEYIFKEFVNNYHSKKNESRGAERFFYKRMLNSLYGKFGQRDNFKKIQIGLLKDDLLKTTYYHLFEDYYVFDTIANYGKCGVHIAMFVTSNARKHLYKYLKLCGDEIYYTDTDSLFTTLKLKTGKDIGDLELKYTIKEAIFLFPKLYAFITTDEDKTIIKAKGFNVKNLSFDLFKKGLKGDYSDFKTSKVQISGIFEAGRRHLDNLSVVERNRSIKSDLEKRDLINNIETKPKRI